jgi:hypothetical protein
MSKHKGNKGDLESLLKAYGNSRFIKPTSGKKFRHQARSAVKLEFGPESRQLQAEHRASKMRLGEIGDWFDNYRKTIAQSQHTVPHYFNQAQAQVGRTENTTSAYADRLRRELASEDQSNAQLRGATYDPSGSQTSASAILSRRNLADSYKGMISTNEASNRSSLKEKERIGEQARIDQLLREQARGRSVNADQRALAQRKQAFLDQYRQEQSQNARDFELGLLSAQTSRQGSKLSAQTSRANAALSAHQSDVNSRRSARTSRKNSSARTSRHEDQRTQPPGGGAATPPRASSTAPSSTSSPSTNSRRRLKKAGRHKAIANSASGSSCVTYTRKDGPQGLQEVHKGGAAKSTTAPTAAVPTTTPTPAGDKWQRRSGSSGSPLGLPARPGARRQTRQPTPPRTRRSTRTG